MRTNRFCLWIVECWLCFLAGRQNFSETISRARWLHELVTGLEARVNKPPSIVLGYSELPQLPLAVSCFQLVSDCLFLSPARKEARHNIADCFSFSRAHQLMSAALDTCWWLCAPNNSLLFTFTCAFKWRIKRRSCKWWNIVAWVIRAQWCIQQVIQEAWVISDSWGI